MSELTIVLDRKDMVVTLESETIRVDRPGCALQRIPLNMIARIIVKGNPMVSCEVWRALSEKKIPAVLFPSRGKGEAAYMGTSISGSVNNRMAQYKALNDEKTCLIISRWLLDEKLKGQERVLKGLSNGSDMAEPVRKCRADLQKADNRNSLMGFEGAAAAHYFKIIGKLIPGKWHFTGRNRRPPKDPVNALLSLSYVIGGGEVMRVIQERGLDPAVGFLHVAEPGRNSFMLDILEPLRPEIDWFVLQILDKKMDVRDFTTNRKDGCLLNKAGRKAYYAEWAVWQESSEEEKRLRRKAREVIREIMRFF